jgi:ATP-binding cassette subfamily B protein
MARLRIDVATAGALLDEALAPEGWRAPAKLDAAVRLAQAMHEAGGVAAAVEAGRLVAALCRPSSRSGADRSVLIPEPYWSVTAVEGDDTQIELHGAVLMRVAGLRASTAAAADAPPALSLELAAALSEKPVHVLRTVWGLVRENGLLAPLALLAAIGVATGVVALEAVLLRGLFDVAGMLGTANQRLAAAIGLLVFLAVLAAIELPIVHETLRQGRHLELRLRMALLRKLPRLNDRYFQSRPISDMADRAHGLQATRGLPGLGFQLARVLFELALTLVGVIVISPASAPLALLLVGAAMALPLLAQPMLNERDLRARNHAGALNGFYLDALLGLVPVRAHRAEANVARQHEGLLVEWAGAVRSWIHVVLLANGVHALVCTALAGGLLVSHFVRAGGVGGADLLLVYWVLKLPSLGSRLAALAQQYPAQRNALLRLLEPLAAPSEPAPESAPPLQRGPASLRIENGSVLVAGNTVLRDVNLAVGAGEHVAIVGVSGAGKSSLLGLLLGWHRLSEGRITVDGHELDAAQLELLRRRTAWVDPAVQLWNASFLDNLAYASERQDLERTGAALEAARLRGVLERLPQGLQTVLGEGGALLSGGEGQRLRLGRALLATDTRLALLDEPFRGLDRAQRRQLLTEARHWWHGVTLLCVTHDVGDTAGFDRVLVVEDGRIVEDGAPRKLAKRASRYRALLDAEQLVDRTLWHGHRWRRLAVHDGRVVKGEVPGSLPGAQPGEVRP